MSKTFWESVDELAKMADQIPEERRKMSAVRMTIGLNQHVIPHEDGWAVRSEGRRKITCKYETKVEAIARAKLLARSLNSEFLVHFQDGRIDPKY